MLIVESDEEEPSAAYRSNLAYRRQSVFAEAYNPSEEDHQKVNKFVTPVIDQLLYCQRQHIILLLISIVQIVLPQSMLDKVNIFA